MNAIRIRTTSRRPLQLVIRQALILVSFGIAIGLTGALALTRLLSGLLYGVTPTDPATFAVMAALLGAIALAACLGPARRAARVDPAVALRCERLASPVAVRRSSSY